MAKLPPPTRYRRKNSEQRAWGIIRYAPGSGLLCSDDAAGFDGWYYSPFFTLADITAIAEEWVREHPGWVVAVVSLEQGWFGQGDFSRISRYPLTLRERVFGVGSPKDEQQMRESQCKFRRAEDHVRARAAGRGLEPPPSG
jgi:hypothetical protein